MLGNILYELAYQHFTSVGDGFHKTPEKSKGKKRKIQLPTHKPKKKYQQSKLTVNKFGVNQNEDQIIDY